MEWYAAGGLMVAMILCFMAIGLPVAFAFFTANFFGALIFMGGSAGLSTFVTNSTEIVTRFTLMAVPLFVLMGALLYHSGLAARVFDAIDKMMGAIPGRLSYLTVVAGTLFSSMSGSTMANTALLGTLLVPDLEKRGYKRRMAIGPIIGSGGLAMIIPPSALAVLLASIAKVDVGAVLIAGVLPGLVLAVLYASAIFIQITIDPSAAPQYQVEKVSLLTKISLFFTHIAPMGLIIFSVIGLIIFGITTPSEASAFGVLSVLFLAAVFRTLTWVGIKRALLGTMRVSGMAFLIIVGASTFSQILAFSGASAGMIASVTDLDLTVTATILIMFGVMLVLGMIMDQLPIMLLTVPIFYPLLQALGVDLIWFSLIVLMAMEMSLTTPPFGLLLFIMAGVAPKGTTFRDVVIAGFPFLMCDAILVVMLMVFPPLALYLPSLIQQ